MAKSLPSPWQLIRDSWNEYLRTWNDSLKVSIWFLYTGLTYFALYLSIKLVPNMIYVGVFVALGILCVWSWSIIRLFETCLRLDDGKKPDLSREAMDRSWKLVWPLLWVGILQVLVLLGAATPYLAWRFFAPVYLGAMGLTGMRVVMYLLLLPIVYVGVRMSFSQLTAIDSAHRGFDALASSSDLLRDRWWPIFLRQLAAGVVYGLGIWLVLFVLFFLLGNIVGPEKFLLLADPGQADPLLQGITALLEGITQAIAMPLIAIYTVKLYRAVKASK